MLLLVAGLGPGSACCAQSPIRPAFGLFSADSSPPSASGDEDEIVTDRDSFTPTTVTTGRGRVIAESAWSFVDNRSRPESHSFPELIFRQGVTDWLELRYGWNYEVGGAENPVSGNSIGEFEDEGGLERGSRVLYGLKAAVTEEDGWMPASAVILQGYTPTSGEDTATQMSTTCVFGWQREGVEWDSALRFSTDALEDDDFHVWAPSTVIKVPVGERCKAHAEYFGVFSQGRADDSVQHFFSPGVHVLLTPDFEFGVRVGWGLNDESPGFFSNVGVGVRY